ncbi:MAG: MFS transporter [Dehalococcoidia bacterium]|nr:MFS transporter [Dehalococcoidia bacterium]MSQ16531.1 MFS transporter [Dehalococcoidia bacterium]
MSLKQERASQPRPAKAPLYYGWYIVATCMFIAFVTNGARNAFGIFVLPLEHDFAWSRGAISVAASLGFLVNGLTQPFLGSTLDRLGGRRVILTSLVLFGISTVLLSLTFHYLFLVFVFGFLSAAAMSGSSLTNTGALLTKWFRRKRATVIGLNAAGLSLGGLLLVPFAMYLLQATNWRVTWAVLGLVVLCLGAPVAWFFLRDDPAQMGLLPDGDPDAIGEGGSRRGGRQEGTFAVDRWQESFRSPPIWQMTGAYFVCGATTGVLNVHFVPYAIGRGVSPGTAAMLFGFMMGLNVVGGIGAGMLSDRFSRKNLLALTYFLRGGAYLMLLLIPSQLGLWTFAAVAGFSWIATAPLTTSLTADVYGLKALGTITGVSFLFHALGSFVSILLAGFLFDLTGSYTLPFALAGALLFPAALAAFTIRERKYSSRYQTKPAPVGAAD